MTTLSCRVCSAESAQYVCPRCNIRYCSLDCYKNHSTDCTQKFYRSVCQEELTSLTAGEDEIRKMKEILVRLHEQDLGPAEDSSSGASDSEDDLVPGLSCSRAMLLAEGKLSEHDLTVDEISVLEKHFEKDIAASIVEPWQPWWLSEEAADLQLGASGMRLIQQSKADSEFRNSDPRACEPTADSIGSIPEPPTAPLPSLSSLTSKTPPPVISLHLLDILFSYCLVLRLFNGQYSADPIDAMATVFNASQIICPPGEDILWEEMSINEALVHIISRVTSPSAGRASVLHGFAIGIVSDVSRMLQLGRSIVIVALMDMSRLLNAAKQELQQHICARDKELQTTVLRQAQRKLLFFMSWANELIPQVFEAMATQVELFYAQQKTTMESTLAKKASY